MREDIMNQTQDLSKDNSPRSGKRLLWFLVIPVLLAGSAFFGMKTRQEEDQQLANATKELDVQPVQVIHAERGKSSSDLALPGMIQAFSQSPIYARVDGYVRTWHADIGTHVTKGQLLAEIDAPEVDQQLNQASPILIHPQTILALPTVTPTPHH